MFGVRGMRTLFESNYVLEGLETVALGDRREADYICTRFARIQYIRLKTEHDSLLYVSSWHGGQHQRCTAASYCSSTSSRILLAADPRRRIFIAIYFKAHVVFNMPGQIVRLSLAL